MMGEVVGKAAWICVRFDTNPRGVYEKYLSELHGLMKQPGIMRRESVQGELQVPEGMEVPDIAMRGMNPGKLPGIVIDDDAAVLTGAWDSQGSLENFVGDGYRYSGAANSTAKFLFSVTREGKYEVRIGWAPHANRAKAARVTVEHLRGNSTVEVDQTRLPKGESHFESLGVFEFDSSKNFSVLFQTDGAKGIVHIDAIQILPVNGE